MACVRGFFLAAAAVVLCGCATPVSYLAKQGRYLLRYSTGAKSSETIIASGKTAAETRDFLIRARDIRRFASERIGLRENGNFTRYREIDRDYLVSVVSACDAVSFDAYGWHYPFLGRLPYRGFYEKPDADREAARLKSEGWDVLVRPVDSFSTLGFTRDPLYSFMKKYSPFELASLIIHEQTHAMLFVKGQPQFNEELASLVGQEGALVWLRDTYGAESAAYRQALDEIADSDAFVSLLRDLAARLNREYRAQVSREDKLARKAKLIAEFRQDFERTKGTRFRTEAYRTAEAPDLNNAYLSLYSLYSDDVPLIRSYWQKVCAGDLRRLLADAKAFARRGDVKAQMRRAIEGS